LIARGGVARFDSTRRRFVDEDDVDDDEGDEDSEDDFKDGRGVSNISSLGT
jgi:hypothetical protein